MNFRTASALIILILAGCIGNFRSTGSVKIRLADKSKKERLDTIEIRCPYGYQVLDFQVFYYKNFRPNFGSRGLSRCSFFFDPIHSMNNYMHTGILDLKKLNSSLEIMETEKPYLIWQYKNTENKETETVGLMFLMFTKEESLMRNEKELFKIAEKNSPVSLDGYIRSE